MLQINEQRKIGSASNWSRLPIFTFSQLSKTGFCQQLFAIIPDLFVPFCNWFCKGLQRSFLQNFHENPAVLSAAQLLHVPFSHVFLDA